MSDTSNTGQEPKLKKLPKGVLPIKLNEEFIQKQEKNGAVEITSMARYSAYYPGNDPSRGLIRTKQSYLSKIKFSKLRAKPREMLVRFGLFTDYFLWDKEEDKQAYMKISRQEAREMDLKDPNLK